MQMGASSKSMQTPIRLIIGLGNPGPQYAPTRHNVGMWFVQFLAMSFRTTLRPETKFSASLAEIANLSVKIACPSTYMNESGSAVQKILQYYKIAPEETLIAHDELDFPAGIVRLKMAGGHGGHNGLRDIFAVTHSQNFARLRIGIGHPGNKALVERYVLSPPTKAEQQTIETALENTAPLLGMLTQGKWDEAVRTLHQQEP